MERLEPILKQKFWILLGVTLIMAITGWWLSTSALAKTIAERTSAIEAAFNKVPQGAVPNENWVKELNSLNSNQESAIAVAKSASWKQQREKMMQWPEGVQPTSYWGKFSTVSRDQIRRTYESEVRRVWKMVDPLDPDDIDGTGVVFYQQKRMYDIVRKPWVTGFKIEDEDLWQNKEDLWLLERLFQTIASVNGGPGVTQNEAVLHTIDVLQLRGGGGPKAAPGSGGTGGAAAGLAATALAQKRFAQAFNAEKDADDAAAMPTDPNAGGYSPAPVEAVSAEFDPAEELGADGSAGARGLAVAVPGESLDGGPAVIKRYVVEDESLPYKTRGFYLSVKMDHRRIPALIAELTASEDTILPIEIMRVQMSRLYEDSVSKYVPPTTGAVPTAANRNPFNNNFSRIARQDEDDPSVTILRAPNRGGLTPGMTSEDRLLQSQQAEISQRIATFDKVIADPVMSQVTICGVFILFKKADDVAPPSATPGATPAAEAPAAAPTETEVKDEASAATAEEPAVATEAPMTEGDAAAPAATTEEPSAEPTEATNEAAPAADSAPAAAEGDGAAPNDAEQQK